LEAKLTNGDSEVFIASRSGFCIRFHESAVRPMGRSATGVRGINLSGKDDAAVGMVCIDPADKDQTIMVISEKGNGKRSHFEEYRLTNRGGKGVKTMQVTEKTGSVIAIKTVKEEDDLMITSRLGITIRMPVEEIRVMGRATQGVRVIRIDNGDKIADVAVVRENGEDEEIEEGSEAPENGPPPEENEAS